MLCVRKMSKLVHKSRFYPAVAGLEQVDGLVRYTYRLKLSLLSTYHSMRQAKPVREREEKENIKEITAIKKE